jgi:membrane protease YdiL (CAAX protease family)
MSKPRVNAKWYAFILIIPLTTMFIFTFLSAWVSKTYAPAANIGFGIIIGGLAGFLEETGWTGFALPRLQSKHSVFASGLILGLLWAIWHGMADFWGNFANFGVYWFPTFIIYWILPLSAYRILMAYVYKHTNSLLLAQLMHMFYTGTLVALSPTMSVTEGWLWQVPFAFILWIAAIWVVLYKKN